MRAGVPGELVAFHGNNKLDRELELAVEVGVGLVVADNPEELERLDRIARSRSRVQPVLVRVIPEVEAGTHRAIETGAVGSKFGVPLAEVERAAELATTLPGVRFRGLHAHIGSQVLRAEPYLAAVYTLLDLIASLGAGLGLAVEILDLGGGFGVAYTDESALLLPELARTVLPRLEEGAASRGIPMPEVVVEPGRSLVANAGLTIYRTGAIKRIHGRTIIAVDGGMSDNVRPMLYGARFAVARASASRGDGSAIRASVVGRHCESGDVLAEDAELPADLRPGDLLAFAATGAYTYSMASNYNRVGRPPVVGVSGGGARLWLRREDAADLDRLEAPDAEGAPELRELPGVLVRPARPKDAASFLELWRSVVAEQRYVRSEDVRHPLRVYRRRFRHAWTAREAQVVAVEGGRVIGHLYIQRDEHPVTRHVATLGIAIEAAWRSRGVGSLLMSEAVRWARGNAIEKIVLSVYPHNAAAVALYRKFGFVEEGRLVRQSRKSYGYEDEILMALWLGPEDAG
jgi:diaminopimelate decarboxylase